MVAVTTTDYFFTNDFFATVVRPDVDVTPVGLEATAVINDRNWVRNPDGHWVQNATIASSVADGAYGKIDLWWALTQTANITMASAPGGLAALDPYYPIAISLLQPQASAQRMGMGHLVRTDDAIYLGGQTVTFSASFQPFGAAATWRIAILSWTGTTDAPTKDVVNTWTSTTYTEGNFFISSADYTVVATAEMTAAADETGRVVCSGVIPNVPATNVVVVGWTVGTVAQNNGIYVFRNTLKIGNDDAPSQLRAPAEELDLIRDRYRVARRAYSEYLTHGSTGTTIPYDDTIPQIGEGVEILSATIVTQAVPTNISNRIRCTAVVNCSGDAQLSATAALFRAGTSNALTASVTSVDGADFRREIVLLHEEAVPAAGTSTTYSVRIGPAANTMYLNGNSGTRTFGGVSKCTLVVEEIEGVSTI